MTRLWTCRGALEWVRTTGVDTRKPDDFRSICFLCEYVRRAERQLPVSPDVFDREIMHKSVTNGNDKQVFLKDKFRETFLAVMEPAKKISLEDIPGPSSTEWRLFLQETLRWCPRLQHINLSCNESIREATLEPFAALGATLEYLDVSMCAGFAGTLDALKHLRKLRELYLYGCVDLEGSFEPLRNLRELVKLNVEACFGLEGGVRVLATLPKLQNLNISDTRLDAEGFVAVSACRIGRWGDELTPLWCAAALGQTYTARRLLEGTTEWRGVAVDRATGNGNTPLLEAANRGILEVAKVLLQHGADANKALHDGTTPLHFAAFKGSVEVAEVLLESRADMNNNTNIKDVTSLHLAADYGPVAVARLLLQSRADTTLRDQWRRTPLATVRRRGHEEVAMLLAQAEEGGAHQ